MLPAEADAGLAHGRAGIGFALSRWADVTGENSFRSAATDLINSDLEAIASTRSKHAELERTHEQNASHLGWCRGFVGAFLGALKAKIPPISIKEDNFTWLQRIANEIISLGVEGPICLCHGALGHMEFLETMAKRGMLHNPKAADEWRGLLLARLLSGDWVSDETHSFESPGLMLGLAGTGYALLRAIYPQRITSILTVEPAFAING